LTNTLNKPTNLLIIEALPSFERDLKRLEKKKADKSKLLKIINDLANNKILAPKYVPARTMIFYDNILYLLLRINT